MHYMLLVYSREGRQLTDEEHVALVKGHWAVMNETRERGILLGAGPLQPTVTATTVRMEGDKPIVLDGPFAETKEQLAGYYLLDCKDLDEAIEWAKRIPTLCRGMQGCIEIRPMAPIPPPASAQ